MNASASHAPGAQRRAPRERGDRVVRRGETRGAPAIIGGRHPAVAGRERLSRFDKDGDEARQPDRGRQGVGVDEGDDGVVRLQPLKRGELVDDLLPRVLGETRDRHFERRARLAPRRGQNRKGGIVPALDAGDDPVMRVFLGTQELEMTGEVRRAAHRQDDGDFRLDPRRLWLGQAAPIGRDRKRRTDILQEPEPDGGSGDHTSKRHISPRAQRDIAPLSN